MHEASVDFAPSVQQQSEAEGYLWDGCIEFRLNNVHSPSFSSSWLHRTSELRDHAATDLLEFMSLGFNSWGFLKSAARNTGRHNGAMPRRIIQGMPF